MTIISDIVVVGGGISGLITSIFLARNGFKVILLEKRDLNILSNDNTDGRAFALSYGSAQILKNFDIWKELESFTGLIEKIRVSDTDSLLHLHFDNKVIAGKPLGYMIEQHNLLKTLFNIAKNYYNLKILSPSPYSKIEYLPNKATITLQDNTKVETTLIIAADGKNSSLREKAKIKNTSWSYHQTAIVCNVTHELNHQNIAQERFFPAGPFAVLPLKGGKNSSIVWTERNELASIFLKMPQEELLEHLKERFTDYLGEIKISSPIFSYPVNASFAEKYYSNRLALIADAAHAIHPIAGQGLNLGIKDIDILVGLINTHKKLGLDIGSLMLLKEYQKARHKSNIAMLTITDTLNRLFSNNISPLNSLRRVGLATVNKIPSLKKFFMLYAMGQK